MLTPSGDPIAGAPSGVAAGGSELAALEADLRRRLHHVCLGWDEQEFEALVRRIAWRKRCWADAGYHP